MARHFDFAWVVLLTLAGSGVASAAPLCDAQQQRGDKGQKSEVARPNEPIPRFKWWVHSDSKKELVLTDKQSKKVDEIWEETAPRLREKWHELEKLEAALAKTINDKLEAAPGKSTKENTADVSLVSQQIEKVEALRAEHNTIRVLMIYRMNLLLTPEQRVKVDAIRAKLEQERERRRRDEEARKRQQKEEDPGR